MAHRFDVVAIGIEDERTVVRWVVLRSHAGRSVVRTASLERGSVKRVDGLPIGSRECDVARCRTESPEMAALVTSAMQAIKGVQLLTGGPTERIGYTVKDSAPEWMHDKLAAPAPPPTVAATSEETEVPENTTRQ